MIKIMEVDSSDALFDLRRDYLNSLAAPFDGMWEAFAEMSRSPVIDDPRRFYEMTPNQRAALDAASP